jgi:hypothetical protein
VEPWNSEPSSQKSTITPCSLHWVQFLAICDSSVWTQEVGKDALVSSFRNCNINRIYWELSNKEAEAMWKACSTHGWEGMRTKLWRKNLQERNHTEYLGDYGRIILKEVWRRWCRRWRLVVGSCEDGNTRQVSQNFVMSSRATSGFVRRILLFGARWLSS